MNKIYLGVDIGGTSIKYGLVSEDGVILKKNSFLVDNNLDQYSIIEKLSNELNLFIKENNLEHYMIEGVGIGCPGSVNSEEGICDFSNNLKWNDLPVKQIIENNCKIKCKISNDANAATLGEMKFGIGKNYKNAIMLTLGTGVGGGIIINGFLYEGNEGKGAELGHSTLRINGRKCTCGRRGCIEAYASASALIKDGIRAMKKEKKSSLWERTNYNPYNLNGKILLEEAKKEDQTALKVFNEYCNYLKEAILNYCNVFRPELIVLGGGISAQKDMLINTIEPMLEKEYYGFKNTPKVELKCAELGNDAGIIGAASLIIFNS